MLRIVMIRHFATKGNLNQKYIGITDESLCEAGKKSVQDRSYPMVEAVFTSPFKRCVETAKLIYPGHSPVLEKELSECNFGDFENKNYKELSNNTDYQAWIDSGGTLSFPNGETLKEFKARSLNGFCKVLQASVQAKYKTIAMVMHGGTIMSILDKYSYPHEDYYHWKVSNGKGFVIELKEEEERLTNLWDIL